MMNNHCYAIVNSQLKSEIQSLLEDVLTHLKIKFETVDNVSQSQLIELNPRNKILLIFQPTDEWLNVMQFEFENVLYFSIGQNSQCENSQLKSWLIPIGQLVKDEIGKTVLNSIQSLNYLKLQSLLSAGELLNEQVRKMEQDVWDYFLTEHLNLILELEKNPIGLNYLSIEEQWNEWFSHFNKRKDHCFEYQLRNADRALDVMHYADYAFRIPKSPYIIFLSIKKKSILEREHQKNLLLAFYTCAKVFNYFENEDKYYSKVDEETDFWKVILSKLPYPIVLVARDGELLLNNELFAKIGLLPRECLKFKDQESVEINESYYFIYRKELSFVDLDFYYFVFYTIQKEESVLPLSEVNDFGIVSSSIAHELNNPIAGILAALSVLKLEDEWARAHQEELAEMNLGATRCKELIDIFLGFSKMNTDQNINLSPRKSLDQAINLLKSRMMETNLRIEIEYLVLQAFAINLNQYVLAMIYYIIFSESLTAFEHHRLLMQNNQLQLHSIVQEESFTIFIKFNHQFDFNEKIKNSKLLNFLLMFEKLDLKLDQDQIVLSMHHLK